MQVIIRTRCPRCGRMQNSEVVMRRKCVYCGHTFILFPKNEKARVYGIVRGTYKAYMKQANQIWWKLEAQRRNRKIRRRNLGKVSNKLTQKNLVTDYFVNN